MTRAGALARYTANGRLDPAFAAGGRVLTDFGSPSTVLRAVAIQADRKIVVAGGSYDPHTGASRFGLARDTVRGHLDKTFGANAATSPSRSPATRLAALSIRASGAEDGSFVVAGSVDGSSGRRDAREVAVSRYMPNGGLDPSFGRGGKAVTDLGAGAIANAIAVQTNGKIVAAGTRDGIDFASVRYLASGKLDVGFGPGGHVLTDFGPVWSRPGRRS